MHVCSELGGLSLEEMHLHETAATDHRQIFEFLAELTTLPLLLNLLVDTVLD